MPEAAQRFHREIQIKKDIAGRETDKIHGQREKKAKRKEKKKSG